MRITNRVMLLCIFLAAFGCKPSGDTDVKTGIWRGVLSRDGQQLPLLLDIGKNADGKTFTVFTINAGERLRLDSAYIENDSLHMPMELFDSEIVAKIEGDKLSGRYNRLQGKNIIAFLPFEATFGENYRFYKEGDAKTTRNISGKWSTIFVNPSNGDSTVAVGSFQQKGSVVEGSFLTATGDYRYLSGSLNGDSLFLSTFDADNAKLFKAAIQKDGTLSGALWSGVKAYKTWTAKPDPQAKLPDATSLTYLKPGFDAVNFTFPDANGKQVSFSDPIFKNKVVVIQILGSWCPNCMDETNFLSPWIKKNRGRGIEALGLAFEHSDQLEVSGPKLRRMIDRYGIDYQVLLAGTNTNEATAKALPMLSKVISYPTSIIIDKKGKVRRIHTGFSGPGTGKYYEQFVEEFNGLIDKLVSEK
jgi:peroxiredoxin